MVAVIQSIAGPTGGPGTQVQFDVGRSGFSQQITLTAAQRFTISVQYQMAGATPVPFQLDYFDGASTHTYSANFTPAAGWQTASFTVTGYTNPSGSTISIVNNTSQIAGLVNFYGFKVEAGETATGYNDPSLQTTTLQPNTNLWPTQDVTQFSLQSGASVVGTTTGETTGTTGTTLAFTTSRNAFAVNITSLANGLTAGAVYTVSVRYKIVGTAVAQFVWNYWDGNSTDNYSAPQIPTASWQVATHTFTAYSNAGTASSLALVNNPTPRVAGQIEVYGFKLEAGPIATAYIDPALPAPAATGTGIPPQPAVTPAAISGAGYTMVYLDNFFANPLTDGAWVDGNWKIAPIATASNIVWNGSSSVDLLVDATTKTATITTASVTDIKAGYFEITAKWSGDPNQVITLSLLSDQHNNYNNTGTLSDCYPNAPNGSSFEAWGEWNIIKWSPSLYGTGNFITQATQHWSQVNGVCSPATGEQFDKPASNSGTQVMGQSVGSGNIVTASSIDVTQFHTYSLLWQAGTPSGTLSWFIDGTLVTKVVLATQLVFPTGVPYSAVIEQQPYFFALTNSLNGTPATTPQHLTISSVRYWQILPAPLPTAANITATVTSGQQSAINIANFNTGETITSVSVSSPPSHGSTTISGNSILYTSTTGYAGADSLTYQVHNTAGASNVGTISLTVNATAAATFGGGTMASPAVAPAPALSTSGAISGAAWTPVSNATFGTVSNGTSADPTITNFSQLFTHFVANSGLGQGGNGQNWCANGQSNHFEQYGNMQSTVSADPNPNGFYVSPDNAPAFDFTTNSGAISCWVREYATRVTNSCVASNLLPTGQVYAGNLTSVDTYPNPVTNGRDWLWEVRFRYVPAPNAPNRGIAFWWLSFWTYTTDNVEVEDWCEGRGSTGVTDTSYIYSNYNNGQSTSATNFPNMDMRNWTTFAAYMGKDGTLQNWMTDKNGTPNMALNTGAHLTSGSFGGRMPLIIWNMWANQQDPNFHPPGDGSWTDSVMTPYFPYRLEIAYSRVYLR